MDDHELLEFMRGLLDLANSAVFYKTDQSCVIKTPAAILGKIAGRLEYRIEVLSAEVAERNKK